MTKLTLDLETLDVQSFEALDSASAAEFVAGPTETSPACCYTFGCGDSINQAC